MSLSWITSPTLPTPLCLPSTLAVTIVCLVICGSHSLVLLCSFTTCVSIPKQVVILFSLIFELFVNGARVYFAGSLASFIQLLFLRLIHVVL